jgi:DNA primase
LAENAELLVDYFIRDQRETVGGPNAPLEKRAQAAAQVAEKLRLIDDEIQFNLIVRKAESLLGIGEEVIRNLARRPAANQPARGRSPRTIENRVAQVAGDAGSKAEIGLVALALLRPELRTEIADSGASANFEDERLGSVLADLCGTDEDYTALEQWLAERLTPEQQSGVSAIAVGPLIDSLARDTDKATDAGANDLARARALAGDYVAALDRRRRARELATLRRSAAEMGTRDTPQDEAAATAQAVIDLRRETRGARSNE